MSDPSPYVGAMVHYMAGDLDCAAVITHLDYRVSVSPDAPPQLSLPIVVPPLQALLVLSAMQQPFWVVAGHSAGGEVGTWHWPSVHDPPGVEPPEPERLPYSGAIVHCGDKVNFHMPAIVCGVYPDGVTIDAAVMNSGTDKVEFVTAVPRLIVQPLAPPPNKDELTWHWPEDPNAPPEREPRAEE